MKYYERNKQYDKNYEVQYRKKIENYMFSQNNLIGRGYSSNVYKGFNINTCKYYQLAQTVAIKVISQQKIKTDIHRQLLSNQIDSLKTLNHKNIIKCHDVFTTSNNTYIMSQYCSGGDLGKLLKNKYKLQENTALLYLTQIIQGLAQMYKQRIIHRDLKPTNIFLKENQIKIADLGFAKKIDTPDKLRCNVGTPLYMPPESLLHNKYSHKSDVWAVGIIAFELVVGKTPFHASTQKQLINKILVNCIDYQNMETSQQYKKFIRKCIQIDPQKRLNPQELVNAIHNIYNSQQQNDQIQRQAFINIPEDSKCNNGERQLFFNKGNNQRVVFDNSQSQQDLKKSVQKDQLRKNRFQQYQINPDKKKDSKGLKSQLPQWAKPRFTSVDIKQKQEAFKLKQIQKTQKKPREQRVIFQVQQQQQVPRKQVNRKKSKTKVEQILLSKINFCRFLFKTLKLIETLTDIIDSNLKQKILFTLFKNIMSNITRLNNAINFKQNQFNIQGWTQFINSQSITKYQKVFNQYQRRYIIHFKQNHYINGTSNHPYKENEQFWQYAKKISKAFVAEIRKVIAYNVSSYSYQEELPKYLQNFIIGLDYIVSYIQLCQMIQRDSNPLNFATNSKIEYIASGAPVQIYRVHYQKIQEKLSVIGLC